MSKILKKDRAINQKAINAIRSLIECIGDDPGRPELKKSPYKILEVLQSSLSGYVVNPDEILAETIEEVEGYDDIIMLKDINFTSYCEHHFLPFSGKCHIGYIPNKKIAGIGKFAEVLEAFAGRLQIQERLTVLIAEAIYNNLQPKGVGVVIEAKHNCLSFKHSGCKDAKMRTVKMLGNFYEDSNIRNEFLYALK
ncbi:GTP cyclohydrolase I [endosymbiont of Acanthamoeba sp. UWC8]|uniref:GTP cyclohydrolase I n=1 Tax=endosymbiont of Acanthamoeba sp. UWC8 TaxID=86106 RepID=UPI0004D0DF6B|nr:GTP cyclohydrolase I [endosymbiont of Acanthamoeba sp. UWC8]AIF81470.1 GTP cyclohydrolase I [endosymbiont of Acanthamoeba sp. UWC8]